MHSLIRKLFAAPTQIHNVLILSPLLFGVVFLLFNFNRGIDITDEGFYLSYSANAEQLYTHGTNFAHYTGMLLNIANGSVWGYRTIGLFVLLVLTTQLVMAIGKYWHLIFKKPWSQSLSLIYFVAANMACLTYYFSWIPSPSYNWLNLVSCLMVIASLIRLLTLVKKNDPYLSTPGHIEPLVIGFAFMLSFMAKPTSTVLLGLLTFVWISLSTTRRYWFTINLRISFYTITFFVLHVLCFEEGFTAYYERIINSLELRGIIQGEKGVQSLLAQATNDLKLLPYYLIKFIPWSTYVISGIALVNITALFWNAKTQKRWLPMINSTSALLAIVLCFYQLYQHERWYSGNPGGWDLGMISFTFTCAIITIAIAGKLSTLRSTQAISLPIVALITSLLALPLIFSFGSGNGLLLQSSFCFVFYSLSALISLNYLEQDQKTYPATFVFATLVCINSLLILNSAVKKPYRLQPLSENLKTVSFAGGKSTLKLDLATAEYVNNLKTLAMDNGWQPGTHLIDMSGGTPMAAFILEATPLASAWLIGGYKGSEEGAFIKLQTIPLAIIKNSWVLTAPEGTRSHSVNILARLGAPLSSNYELLGELKTGYRNEQQYLYRPKLSSQQL